MVALTMEFVLLVTLTQQDVNIKNSRSFVSFLSTSRMLGIAPLNSMVLLSAAKRE
jgi:hypothetical protein